MAPIFVVIAAVGLASRTAVVAKFDAMISAVVLPPAAIESIDDPRMRTLFRGVAAADVSWLRAPRE